MPLSKPEIDRHLIHTRSITCRAYRRGDGLWDIEGHMTDIKTYPIDNEDRGGTIAAGEPIHGMWLRLTIDRSLQIKDAEASTDFAPFTMCPNITPAYRKLTGLHIGPGWRRKVDALLGGAAGCTHHTELLGPIATTAYQALYSELKEDESRKKQPPAILNTCYTLAESSPVAQRLWPDYTDSLQDESIVQPISGDI